MEESLEHIMNLKRHLNSIEHMLYVSCKFTRTTEMLRKVMETTIVGYEQFFAVAYNMFIGKEEVVGTVHDKIQLLSDSLATRGISVDLSDYFLLKKLMISDFDSVGEYRKNLAIVSYVDGEEYIINLSKLLVFFENLKFACSSLNPAD
ncbi:MAG: hypothetical protein KC550_06480 [Nanoarchaeota archaeon]|nr:hypothetical protein [Nanoarchaeota archaeon]